MSMPTSTSQDGLPATPSPISAMWVTTIGGCRRETCGKWNGCCWNCRIGGSAHLMRALIACVSGIANIVRATSASPFITSAWTGGPNCRRSFCKRRLIATPFYLVKIKVPCRLGDRLSVGLLQRFLESLRQCVAARSLRSHRLLKEILATPCLFFDQALRVAQLRHLPARRLHVPDDSAEIDVNHERCATARTVGFEFRFKRHSTDPCNW